VVEVKSFAEETPQTADSRQVSRYWQHYGCVLVTNDRDFLLVAKQTNGKPKIESRYRLADSAEEFWKGTSSAWAQRHGEALTDFLQYATAPCTCRRPNDGRGMGSVEEWGTQT